MSSRGSNPEKEVADLDDDEKRSGSLGVSGRHAATAARSDASLVIQLQASRLRLSFASNAGEFFQKSTSRIALRLNIARMLFR